MGTVFEGQRRFALAVRFEDPAGQTVEALGRIPVATPGGVSVPLAQVADIGIDTGPAQISREAVRRRIVVESNVRGRDVASFVAEASECLRGEVRLPPGYYVTWGGQFENLQSAARRLAVVVPLVLGLFFAMLLLHLRVGGARGRHLPERPLRRGGGRLRIRRAGAAPSRSRRASASSRSSASRS